MSNIESHPFIDRILERLRSVTKTPNGWMACCPAHEDKDPSLSIAIGKKGLIVLKCFAGCSLERIVDAIGVTVEDLRAPGSANEKKARKVLPPGRYTLRIFSIKESVQDKTGSTGAIAWVVCFVVCSGIHKGEFVFDRFYFAGKGLSRIKSFLTAVGFDTTGEKDVEKEHLIGRMVHATVESHIFDGKEYARITDGSYASPDEVIYNYTDEAGNLIYQVVRFVPKHFLPRRPLKDGAWAWSMDGTRRVIYRLGALCALARGSQVFVVEGEKDADRMVSYGLEATTSSAGSNSWGKVDVACFEALRGQNVVIIPDNDAPGRMYACAVADSLASIAATVRVLDIQTITPLLTPSPGGGAASGGLGVPPKPIKDVSDWFDAGGSTEQLISAISSAPLAGEWVSNGGGTSSTVDIGTKKKPVGGNGGVNGERLVITNYEIDEVDTKDGVKKVKTRIELDEILRCIRYVCNGWPKRIGQDLFIDNNGDCCFIENESDLFAFFHSQADIRWQEKDDDDGRRFVSRKEIVSALKIEAEVVAEFSELPLWPVPTGVYIATKFKPEGDTDGTVLTEFLSRFCPVSPADEALLASLALTPFWGGPPGGRPLFVITGPEGIGVQESGKTTLAEMIGLMVGGLFRIRTEKMSTDPISRQVLSDGALRCRLMLLDNLNGPFDSAELADLVTASWVEGRPAYGRQRRRANRITWVATAVSPELDEDLASRSVVIHISPPDREGHPNFYEETVKFITAGRKRLISDAISTLRGSRVRVSGRLSRFPAWDREVLACHDEAQSAVDARKGFQDAISSRNDDLANFGAYVLKKYAGNFEVDLSPQDLSEAWNVATGKKLSVSWVSRNFRLLLRSGRLFKSISPKWDKKHGSPWLVRVPDLIREMNGDGAGEESASQGEARI